MKTLTFDARMSDRASQACVCRDLRDALGQTYAYAITDDFGGVVWVRFDSWREAVLYNGRWLG